MDVINPTIADDAPETLVVGFEGDDTRIQLQGGKTVWTQGDQVSVFYKSDANQKWQYNGETGSRTAELKRVDAGVASARMDRVVVAYPYSDNYLLNLTTGDIEATMPAVQTYMKDSYGLDGNIMVASSYFTQFNLKNVCGWLKLQLTGDGEVVKSIKLRGNNGEQVAGLIYVDTENATSILASEMGNVTEDDGENITGGAGGNLVFDDTILKEVTLDCGEGVTLGAEATAFYIALPPQTFEKGLTVTITDESNFSMTQTTEKSVTIARNTIQPMAAFEFEKVPNNQIWYTSSDGNIVMPSYTNVFGAKIVSNTYSNGKGVITFDGEVIKVGLYAFRDCTSLTSITLPDSITYIDYGAFLGCANLTSATIGNSVTSIETYTFRDCKSLTSINIPDSVTYIDYGAFLDCTNLTNATIGNSVKTIGEMAFRDCASLISINIPDSVTYIDYCAFSGCLSMMSAKIGSGIKTIGAMAFYECSSLASVYCKATTPPSLVRDNVFTYISPNAKIYVPATSVDTYKCTGNWSGYALHIYSYNFE